MSDALIQIDSPSRRDILRGIAIALTAAGGGVMTLEAAQHVHKAASAEKAAGPYQPKAFEPPQYATIKRLAEIIVPADGKSGSAVEAGAPEFIDLLASQNEHLKYILTGGLAWLDAEMRHRYGKTFAGAAPNEQTAMLDTLIEAQRTLQLRGSQESVFQKSEQYAGFGSYSTVPPTGLEPGVQFFDWVRKMTVDAFYTSPIGIKDIDCQGNEVLSEYKVPQAAIDYAFSRSPFRRA